MWQRSDAQIPHQESHWSKVQEILLIGCHSRRMLHLGTMVCRHMVIQTFYWSTPERLNVAVRKMPFVGVDEPDLGDLPTIPGHVSYVHPEWRN